MEEVAARQRECHLSLQQRLEADAARLGSIAVERLAVPKSFGHAERFLFGVFGFLGFGGHTSERVKHAPFYREACSRVARWREGRTHPCIGALTGVIQKQAPSSDAVNGFMSHRHAGATATTGANTAAATGTASAALGNIVTLEGSGARRRSATARRGKVAHDVART